MSIKLPVKNTLNNRLFIGFTVSFLLVLAIGVTTYISFRKQIEEAHRVSATNLIIGTVDHVERLLVDMETGRRGYRVTNDEQFLEPYYKSAKEVMPVIDSLQTLFTQGIQLQRVNNVETHIAALLDYWADIDIYVHNNGGQGGTDNMVRVTTEEKRKMDRIRVELQEISNYENSQLVSRQSTRNAAIELIAAEVIISTIIIELIIVLLSRVIILEFRKRKKVEEQMNGSLAELELLNSEEQMHNWLLKGTTFLREKLHGVNELKHFSERTLGGIMEYLDVPAGIFYIYDEDTKTLEQYASVGVAETNKLSFTLNQGLVGAAAHSRNYCHIKNVPPGYWKIRSGSGAHVAGELFIIPYFFDKELKGVVELASFQPFEKREITFLQSLYNALGIGINACKAHDKMVTLVERVNQQNGELEQQQEELRQTNEELTRQAEHLQASEEELRVHEEELRQINAELEEKNEAVESARATLNVKAQELERATKYKSEFLANMSHELRTPLNSVLILAKLLKDNKQGNLIDKQVEYASIIHRSGTDLLDLINDILDLSKIEAGKVEVLFEKVKVAEVVEDMKQLFSAAAEDKGLNFRCNITPEVSTLLYTDKQKLEQVVKNLISNAFKFTAKGGNVNFTFRKAEKEDGVDMVAIDVTDTGIGIPKDKQQVIFEAFQQADGSTSRRFGGTGLGLSISKELVRLLHGKMKLVSEQGIGSTFSIIIPASAEAGTVAKPEVTTPMPRKDDAQPVALEELGTVKEQTLVADDRHDILPGDKTMLIIEDDKDFASIIRDFARNKGYKTIVALQGDEGIQYALKYLPDAITLDMQLPVIHGKNVLKTFKAHKKLKDIPVHIIAGTDANVDINEAVAFLHKPVELDDLEHAFTVIGKHLKAKVKKVLIISGNFVKDIFFDAASSERSHDISYDYARNEKDAIELLNSKDYDCIIADIDNNIPQGIEQLQQLQQWTKAKNIPVIIYLDKDLSGADEMQLKKFSDAIIRDSSFAHDRLMDELELFLYKIQQPVRKNVPVATAMQGDDLLKGKKVLLADDDMRNVFAISTLLEEQEMIVFAAADGKEAIDVLHEHEEIDIVLMDIMMPEMDGHEAMRAIRAENKYNKLPIIALTAKAMSGDYENAIAAGASDYITKPVDSNRLFSLMRVWLSK